MSVVLSLSGSPSASSRTNAVLAHIGRRLQVAGHQVQQLSLRDLPAAALLAGDRTDPQVAAAVQRVVEADALVLGSPVYQAAYSGLLKTFLDLLPQNAFRGKAVLPVVTGGSPAHVLAVDYALRPVLHSLGADHVGPGWFVLARHVRLYPDGGAVLDPEAATPLAEVTGGFLRQLDARALLTQPTTPAPPAQPTGTAEPAPVAGPAAVAGSAADAGPAAAARSAAAGPVVRVRVVRDGDPALAALLAELKVEYGTRYGRVNPNTELTEVDADEFHEPNGVFLVLERDGHTIAGGALRRKAADTAEVKRVWTDHRERRQGLGRRVLDELERAAVRLGYRRLYLTTGPRQPEAVALYRAAGYRPQFDVAADPETIGPLAFVKELTAPIPADPTGTEPTAAAPALRPALAGADR